MGHELAAFRAMSGRGGTDLYCELVWPMHFLLMHSSSAGAENRLWVRVDIVPARAGGEAKRPGEDLFELGIAVDAPPDVADDAAQTGREPAQASVGVDGHGHSSMLDHASLPTRKDWRSSTPACAASWTKRSRARSTVWHYPGTSPPLAAHRRTKCFGFIGPRPRDKLSWMSAVCFALPPPYQQRARHWMMEELSIHRSHSV